MELHPNIEQLLLSKAYTELTDKERLQIEPLFDKNTYGQYRQVLLLARQAVVDTPPPPINLEHRLLHSFDQQFPTAGKSSKWKRFRHFSVPAYLATVGTLAGIFFGAWLFSSEQQIFMPSEKVYLTHTDTIYIEIQPPVGSDKMRSLPPVSQPPSSAPVPQKPVAKVSPEPISKPQIAETPKGRSIQNDPDLLNVVVKVY